MSSSSEDPTYVGDLDEWMSIDTTSFSRLDAEVTEINDNIRKLDCALFDSLHDTRDLSAKVETIVKEQEHFKNSIAALECSENRHDRKLSDLEASNNIHTKNHSLIVASQKKLETGLEKVQDLEKRIRAKTQDLVDKEILRFDTKFTENVKMTSHILDTEAKKVREGVSNLEIEITKSSNELEAELAVQTEALGGRIQTLSDQTRCSISSLRETIDNLQGNLSHNNGHVATLVQDQKNLQQVVDTFKRKTCSEDLRTRKSIEIQDARFSHHRHDIGRISKDLESLKGTTNICNEKYSMMVEAVQDSKLQGEVFKAKGLVLLDISEQVQSLMDMTKTQIEGLREQALAQEMRYEGRVVAIEDRVKTKLMDTDSFDALRLEVLELSKNVSTKTIEQALRNIKIQEEKLRGDAFHFSSTERSKEITAQIEGHTTLKMKEFTQTQESKFKDDINSLETNILVKVDNLIKQNVSDYLEKYQKEFETTMETKVVAQVIEQVRSREARYGTILAPQTTERVKAQERVCQANGLKTLDEYISMQISSKVEELSKDVEDQVLERVGGSARKNLEQLDKINRRLFQTKPNTAHKIHLLISHFVASSLVDNTLDLPSDVRKYNNKLITYHPMFSRGARKFFAGALRENSKIQADIITGELLDEASLPKEIPVLSVICALLDVKNPLARASYSEMLRYVIGEKIDFGEILELINL